MANDMLEKEGVAGLTASDFRGGENKEIFKSLQLWAVSETPKIETLVSMVDEVLERRLAVLASHWHRRPLPPAENITQDLSVAVLRLRLQNVDEQINALTFLQREAVDNKDTPGARQYTEMAEAYSRQRKKLEQTRDALSLMGQRRAESNRFG
jgi:hypothetical protein